MKKLVIASTDQSAGKTSIIVGLARAWGKHIGYLKPLGDRLLYKKKRQWDYDASVVTSLCGVSEDPETMTIGFEHSKLHYMYDEEGIREKLAEMTAAIEGGKDVIIYEAGRNMVDGVSVNLGAMELAKHVGGSLVIVASGTDDAIIDNLTFAKGYVEYAGVEFAGAIINKVRDPADFRETYAPSIEEYGVKVLGIIPHCEELSYFKASYLADKLFAKVIAGEEGLNATVKHIVVGAMSANAALGTPVFNAENKLVITSGDRSDMIIAALETKSAGVVITHNILPPPNIIAKATELKIPLLLVRYDTFAAAKQIDDMEPLITIGDTARADFLAGLVKEHVDLNALA